MTGTILVADDAESIRWVLATALSEGGHIVEQVGSGDAALRRLLHDDDDVALVDISMPGLDGLELVSKLREVGSRTQVIVITRNNTMRNAVEAMKRGAYDYLTKPFDIDDVRRLVGRVLELRHEASKTHCVEEYGQRRSELGAAIIGTTPAMQEIFKTVGRVAPTEATVLIQGESGTGKELIARAVHAYSLRSGGAFVALNCSAVPRDLLESELVGHERGAFTGASEQRAGMFEVAAGVTLFLDEIADMPLDLQAKLLRVVQERELTRLGGRELIKVDCRLIAATNRDLSFLVSQGRFREDLYFRLKVVPISLPPLRQRRGDLPALVTYLLNKINNEMHTHATVVSPEAQALLNTYSWPGNVRELENTLVRAAVLARDLALPSYDVTTPPDDTSLEELVRLKLKDYFRQMRGLELTNLYPLIVKNTERPLIELVLERTHGNQLRAAAILGINRNTLYKEITQLNISPRRSAEDTG